MDNYATKKMKPLRQAHYKANGKKTGGHFHQ